MFRYVREKAYEGKSFRDYLRQPQAEETRDRIFFFTNMI